MVGRDLWRPSSPTLLLKQAYPEQPAQGCVQYSAEWCQRKGFHNMSEQLVPVFCHPQIKEVLPHTWVELSLFHFAPVATYREKCEKSAVLLFLVCFHIFKMLWTERVDPTCGPESSLWSVTAYHWDLPDDTCAHSGVPILHVLQLHTVFNRLSLLAECFHFIINFAIKTCFQSHYSLKVLNMWICTLDLWLAEEDWLLFDPLHKR